MPIRQQSALDHLSKCPNACGVGDTVFMTLDFGLEKGEAHFSQTGKTKQRRKPIT